MTWDIKGPLHNGWIVNTFGRAPDGGYLLSTGSTWYGAALRRIGLPMIDGYRLPSMQLVWPR